VPLLATQAERNRLEQDRQKLKDLEKQLGELTRAGKKADAPELVQLKAERDPVLRRCGPA